MTRYEKSLALTINELDFFLSHKENFKAIAELFAQGGYGTMSDEELDEAFDKVFGNVFNCFYKGENHGA
jgi:hypothetical protein